MFQRLGLSDAANEDLIWIQMQSVSMFGEGQADRYWGLLVQALSDIDIDPLRPGSQSRPDLGEGFRSYRVDLSRQRSGTGVKSSRHVVIYVDLSEQGVGVSRVLHDSMVMERHIPPEHRSGPEAFARDEEE